MRAALPFVLLLLAAGSAGAGRVDNPTLNGDVGLGGAFTISLHDASGVPVKNLDPGTYTLNLRDHSDIHNFHLFGPGGVDVSTDIGNVENKTFTVTLVVGTYKYICDAHPDMKGSFTVGGAVATPPPATGATTKLTAAVGPGATISLRAADGKALSGRKHGVFDRDGRPGRDDRPLGEGRLPPRRPRRVEGDRRRLHGQRHLEADPEGGQLHVQVGQARRPARRVFAEVAGRRPLFTLSKPYPYASRRRSAAVFPPWSTTEGVRR